MSEVQPVDESHEFSGPPSPAQDALEVEPALFKAASEGLREEQKSDPDSPKATSEPVPNSPALESVIDKTMPEPVMPTPREEAVKTTAASELAPAQPPASPEPALKPERSADQSARGPSETAVRAEPPPDLPSAGRDSPEAEAEPAPTPPDSGPPAAPAVDAGQDDSGCDTEPEPAGGGGGGGGGVMSDPAGPAMADVEQLARSVVSDTLERAKHDAKLQRELEQRRGDPDCDADGWLDVVGNGQLKKKVLTPGTGDRGSRPKRSQLVTVQQVSARLEDGRSVSCEPARLTFGLGDGEVITGLDMAVALMQPGETAEIYMDSRFAYGEKGLDDSVPPDSNITFTIRLEKVEPEPKYEDMSAQERLTVGSQKRDRGNWWFKREDFNHAIQCYRRALDFFDDESDEFTGLPDDVHVLFEERLKVHNNMAAAQMKLEAYDAALRSVQVVLSCQPDNVKALYRKGKILIAQNKLPEAAEALKKALANDPDNRTVQTELSRLMARQRKLAEEQKSLYRKMLGLPPADDKPAPVAPGKSFPVKLLVCGVACALAAIAVSRLKLF